MHLYWLLPALSVAVIVLKNTEGKTKAFGDRDLRKKTPQDLRNEGWDVLSADLKNAMSTERTSFIAMLIQEDGLMNGQLWSQMEPTERSLFGILSQLEGWRLVSVEEGEYQTALATLFKLEPADKFLKWMLTQKPNLVCETAEILKKQPFPFAGGDKVNGPLHLWLNGCARQKPNSDQELERIVQLLPKFKKDDCKDKKDTSDKDKNQKDSESKRDDNKKNESKRTESKKTESDTKKSYSDGGGGGSTGSSSGSSGNTPPAAPPSPEPPAPAVEEAPSNKKMIILVVTLSVSALLISMVLLFFFHPVLRSFAIRQYRRLIK